MADESCTVGMSSLAREITSKSIKQGIASVWCCAAPPVQSACATSCMSPSQGTEVARPWFQCFWMAISRLLAQRLGSFVQSDPVRSIVAFARIPAGAWCASSHFCLTTLLLLHYDYEC